MERRNFLSVLAIGAIFPIVGSASLPSKNTKDVYVALFTSDGLEVNGAGYARQKIDIGSESDIVFPSATDDWGEVTHCELLDYSCKEKI